MAVVTLSEMMEAGAHFGHQTRRWNPKMSRYIYCARNGVHIIDLVQTAVCMNNAYKWTRSAARKNQSTLHEVGWESRPASKAVHDGCTDMHGGSFASDRTAAANRQYREQNFPKGDFDREQTIAMTRIVATF